MNIRYESECSRSAVLDSIDPGTKAIIPATDDQNVGPSCGSANGSVDLEQRSAAPRPSVDEDDAGTVKSKSGAEVLNRSRACRHEIRTYRHGDPLDSPGRNASRSEGL